MIIAIGTGYLISGFDFCWSLQSDENSISKSNSIQWSKFFRHVNFHFLNSVYDPSFGEGSIFLVNSVLADKTVLKSIHDSLSFQKSLYLESVNRSQPREYFWHLKSPPGHKYSRGGGRFTDQDKDFSEAGAIVDAFQYCLVCEDTIDKKNRSLSKGWIVDQIEEMKIYVAEKFGPLNGVTLTDGIFITLAALVDKPKSGDRHDASLYTIACHQSIHYLARMHIYDYNFLNEKQTINVDKVKGEKSIEMSRFLELTLFGNVQQTGRIRTAIRQLLNSYQER